MTIKAAIDQQPDAWRPFTKPPRGTRDPELNLDARAQASLDRIAPLSADLAAHGRTRALALKKLRRICQAELRRLQARALSGYRQTLSLQVPRRYPPNRPKPPRLAPQKDALRPAFFLPRSSSRRNSSAQCRLPPAHPPGPIQLDPSGSGGLHPKSARPLGQRPLSGKRHGPHGPDQAPAGRDLL